MSENSVEVVPTGGFCREWALEILSQNHPPQRQAMPSSRDGFFAALPASYPHLTQVLSVPAGSSFDNSAKEQIKQAVDIVDLVGDYIPLRREGRGYKGICPWHDDSRPSLQVNPDRQSFKCWVCDIGGDIFSFVMKHEGVEFREALTILAQRAGITLTPSRPGASGIEPDQKSLLYEVLAWAEQQFHDFLMKAPEAEPARKYIQSRQLTPDSVKRFHIGYSPDAW
ncbi:MAG: CHC2 zinc finger domain-containing protein, partial [Pirellulales bacterium]